MTPTMEPATEKQHNAPAGFSPKPKPCVTGAPTNTAASFSPKPKPCVAGSSGNASANYSPKPKPAVAIGSPASVQGSLTRLAPLETYVPDKRVDGDGPKALPAGSDMSSKPLAKKRFISMFQGADHRN